MSPIFFYASTAADDNRGCSQRLLEDHSLLHQLFILGAQTCHTLRSRQGLYRKNWIRKMKPWVRSFKLSSSTPVVNCCYTFLIEMSSLKKTRLWLIWWKVVLPNFRTVWEKVSYRGRQSSWDKQMAPKMNISVRIESYFTTFCSSSGLYISIVVHTPDLIVICDSETDLLMIVRAFWFLCCWLRWIGQVICMLSSLGWGMHFFQRCVMYSEC